MKPIPQKVFFRLVAQRLNQIQELIEDVADFHEDREFTREKVDQWISQALEQIQIIEEDFGPEESAEEDPSGDDPAPNSSDWTKQS